MAASRLRHPSIAHPMWIAALLALTFLVGLMVANAGARDWYVNSGSSTSVAVPDTPPSQLVQSHVRMELYRVHSEWSLPTEAARLFAGTRKLADFALVRGAQHRGTWRKLCPLYRRPPPISS